MDFTPLLSQPQPQSQPLTPSASKLPVKRKSPFAHQFLTPKLESQPQPQPIHFDNDSPLSPSKPKPPPFKFHRIWTEPDEISFLQALLHSHSLSFPKDLPIFYSTFSNSISTSHPYTKSQLSEKLRRLRKKFRVISSRLARGLSLSALSAHDQALFDLSKRLWSPEFASASPFGKNTSGFNLGLSLDHDNNGIVDGTNDFEDCYLIDNDNDNDNDGEVKMVNEVNVNCDFGGVGDEVINGGGIYRVVAKSVLDVFDECFKEVRMVFANQGVDVVWMDAMERRWKQQRVSELDVLGRRLRLVLENSLTRP